MYMEKYKQGVRVNSLLKIKTDFSKLKAFADHRLNVTQMKFFFFDRVESIVKKKKKSIYQHILLFQYCFQKPLGCVVKS